MKKFSNMVPFLFTCSLAIAAPVSEVTLQNESSPIVIITVSVIILLFVIVALALMISKNRHQKRMAYRSALHISEFPEECTFSVGNKKISLKKLLRLDNTLLYTTESVLMLRKRVSSHMPDLLIIDCRISKTIAKIVEKILANYRLSSATTILFYNCRNCEELLQENDFNESEVHVIEHFPTEKLIDKLTSSSQEDKSESKEYLSGLIHDSSLQDVLQFIASTNKTGCLVIEDEDPFGVIFFNNGNITSSVLRNGNSGLAAVYEILNCKSGSFYFKLDKQPHQEELNIPVMAVLMQWSTERDQFIHETGQYDAISS